MRHGRHFGRLSIAGLLLASAAVPALAESPVTFDRLSNPEPENWLTAHGTYDQWRHSALTELTPENVGGLRLAFAAPLGAPVGTFGNETVPLVDDGFLYITNATSQVFKFNVQGNLAQQVWSFDPEMNMTDAHAAFLVVNRGVALNGDLAILNTTTGRVIALDRNSGEPVWDLQVAIPQAESFTAQPLALRDMVLVANARGDIGGRGWAAALNAETGDEVWRFHMIPGPGEPGHETWPADSDAWQTGGASIWTQPSYDIETNMLYYGTSNAAPAYDPAYRPGDNLYTSSTVALDADTGELRWYFQYVPNEGFEWDEITPNILLDTEIGGATRQVMAHHSTRNGYFYVFDRLTGEFLFAQPNAESVNWTAGLDPKTGQPVEYDPDSDFQSYDGLNSLRGGATRSGCAAASQWGGQTYIPDLNRIYSTVTDSCFTRAAAAPNYDEQPYVFGQIVFANPEGDFAAGFAEAARPGQGAPVPDDMLRTTVGPHLTATDASTGEIVAAVPVQAAAVASGTLSTTTGLVFTAFGNGWVRAFDAESLATLWEINVGTPFKAPPITYAVNGKQYIAIAGGASGSLVNETAMLWVFSL
ncbi:MAG: PQQ-binding-like beta-propeller repeat protein [Bauldia sp.]|nr:PQQ-binding-like beta-propeller repeat protein [Bauldia sp.]